MLVPGGPALQLQPPFSRSRRCSCVASFKSHSGSSRTRRIRRAPASRAAEADGAISPGHDHQVSRGDQGAEVDACTEALTGRRALPAPPSRDWSGPMATTTCSSRSRSTSATCSTPSSTTFATTSQTPGSRSAGPTWNPHSLFGVSEISTRESTRFTDTLVFRTRVR